MTRVGNAGTVMERPFEGEREKAIAMTGRTMKRRTFLKGLTGAAGMAAGLPTLVPSSVFGANGKVPPSERIAVGFIGVGGHGVGRNLRTFLQQDDAQPVVLCDVDSDQFAGALKHVQGKFGTGYACPTTKDWREVIARGDVDAVMISTPDHWHVPMSVAAIRAGKDVICEKPTLTVAGGRILANTVAQCGAVFQLSTEDRSIGIYHRMAELVRNGRIGRLQRIHVGLPGGPNSPGDPTPLPVPETLDWDMWLGPAPWRPYCKFGRSRCHYDWRWISDYSGGELTDWGAHLVDTAQWGNDTERTGPVTAEGTGKRHAKGLYDSFYQFRVTYTYANGVEMVIDSSGPSIRFEGTEGWVGNKGWRAPLQASSPKILASVIGPGETHLFTCPAGEHRNFLDCVKSRRDPYFPAEIGHRCCSVMHLGNIAMNLGRKLRWDPAAEQFPGEAAANRMLSRAMREPWRL